MPHPHVEHDLWHVHYHLPAPAPPPPRPSPWCSPSFKHSIVHQVLLDYLTHAGEEDREVGWLLGYTP